MPDVSIATSSVSRMAEKALTEGSKGPVVPGESDFSRLLNTHMEGQSQEMKKVMESLGVDLGKPTGLQAISAEGLEINPSSIQPKQEIRTTDKALDLLQGVNRGALQMDNIIEMTTSGRRFTPAELLGMQAFISKASVEMEMTNKVIDMTAQAVKQIQQTNFA